MDALRQRLEANLGERLGPLRCELLLTLQTPFATDARPSVPRPAANS